MKKFSRIFHLYRYQISVTTQQIQLDLYPPENEITSLEDLVSKKNEIFADVLQKQKEFSHPRADLIHKLYKVKDFIVLKIGANRSLIRTTKEFEIEEIDNWPSVYVVINNNPDVQIMAVELESVAFYRTSTVVHILETNLNEKLGQFNLVLQIEPTFVENEFWKIVNSHKNRIIEAKFFMIAPNLADISKNLELDLGEIKKRTNSLNTNMFLKAAKGEALTLSKDDSFTQSLVHYASEGGGTVHLKARGVRKLIKTEDSVKSTEIDEIYFSGDNVPEQIVEQIRKLLE